MRIKSNTRVAVTAEIAAEMGIKPSRAGWQVRSEQAERLARLLEQEDRLSTRKAKRGVQGIAGRTRVERARSAVITAKQVLQLEHLLADMAIAEALKDERGTAYCVRPRSVRRWVYPASLVIRFRGFYGYTSADYVPTIEGLMAFEDALFDGGVLPRGYVTPDEVIAVTGRQLGK